jgi:hypothetical protein
VLLSGVFVEDLQGCCRSFGEMRDCGAFIVGRIAALSNETDDRVRSELWKYTREVESRYGGDCDVVSYTSPVFKDWASQFYCTVVELQARTMCLVSRALAEDWGDR